MSDMSDNNKLELLIMQKIKSFEYNTKRQPTWLIVDDKTFYDLHKEVTSNGFTGPLIHKEYLRQGKEPIDRYMGLKIALVDTPVTKIEIK